MNSKSDVGARAAWKGFSSQTVYIAYRLMILEDKFDIYPENVEDLMIKNDNKVEELIQVKNIGTDLTLSHLKPKDKDSFFRRVLDYKSENLKIKVISFGNIGFELEQVNKRNEEGIKSFKKKMLSYGYVDEEINWIVEHIEIKKENEVSLKEEIFEKLNKDFKTSIADNIIFDCLINYISNLSRKVGMTNNKIWNNKVNEIIKDIVSIKGMHEQYGKTILNLSDYRTDKSVEVLAEEYRNGIDAKPDHIRNNLDIYRDKWIKNIKRSYKENNIVLIRGISGQGKSSLAYRFLMDNFNEEFVFVVEHIRESKQAEDILVAINGLAHSKAQETIIYLDITPYDTSWKWILEQIQKRNLNVKVLITIREEDYKRNNINSVLYELKEIEITLEKDEAKELYNRYGSDYFLNFEEAWHSFGEKGPFMEFMYLLTEKQKLKDKLTSQIDNIIENESDADNWLKLLLIVSFAGKDNYKIDFEILTKKINSNNFSKILKNLQKEYLIKLEEDSKYIISTHALRAKILSDIIMNKIYVNKIELIIDVLSCTTEYYPTLIVEFLYENLDKADEFLKKATSIQYKTWDSYATLIRGILWLDTYKLYIEKKEQFDYENQICNDSFSILFMGDITGYLNYNREETLKSLESINYNLVKIIKEKIELNQFKIKYYYTDLLLRNIKKHLENKHISKEDDYSKVGYVLFWMANRNIYLTNIKVDSIDFLKLEQVLDLMIGLKIQKLDKLYFMLLKQIKEYVIKKYNIVSLEENDEIFVKFLNKLNNENEKSFFGRVMEVIYCTRRLYYDKSKYNVKMIGTDLLEWFKIPDTEKHINCDRLNLDWITDINRQVIDIDDYNKRMDSWESYRKCIDDINELVLEFVKKYCKALDYYYKNNNTKKLIDISLQNLKNDIMLKSKNMNKSPKCTTNKYGLDNMLYSFRNDENIEFKSTNNIIDFENKNRKEFGICIKFEKFISSFTNFTNQRDQAFISKVKREENNIVNISLFNISECLNNYTDFYIEYKKIFGDCIINEQLYEELKILELFWEIFCNQPLIKNKSKLYDVKLIKKKKEENFKEYISENLNKYITRINNKEYYDIDIFNLESFYENLYNPYQNIQITSYEAFLLQEYQKMHENKIEIIYSLGDKKTQLGTTIELKNIVYSKNVDEFMKKQISQKYENNILGEELIDIKDITYNSLLAIGKIECLKTYYRYIISVNNEIHCIDTKECQDVYEAWCEETKRLIKEELTELINSCKIIFGEINKNKKYINITEKYMECLVNYTEILDSVVREKNIDNLLDLEQLNELLVNLINTLG